MTNFYTSGLETYDWRLEVSIYLSLPVLSSSLTKGGDLFSIRDLYHILVLWSQDTSCPEEEKIVTGFTEGEWGSGV